MIDTYEQHRQQARTAAVRYIRGGGTYDQLRVAYDSFCKACHADNDRMAGGAATSLRRLLAQRIVIDSISELDTAQLQALDAALDRLAADQK